MRISEETRNHYTDGNSKIPHVYRKQKIQAFNPNISNLKTLNPIHRLDSSNVPHQKTTHSKKHSFSVSRWLSTNERAVKLITGIGISALILSFVYHSSRTVSSPSFLTTSPSSTNSPDSIEIRPSIEFQRCDPSIPSIPVSKLLTDASSRFEERSENLPPRPLLLSASDSLSIFPLPNRANGLLREVIPRFQQSPNPLPRRLLLSASDAPSIFPLPDRVNAISDVSLAPNLLYKRDNLGKRFLNVFPGFNLHSQTSRSIQDLTATSIFSSIRATDFSRNAPRLSLSNFVFQSLPSSIQECGLKEKDSIQSVPPISQLNISNEQPIPFKKPFVSSLDSTRKSRDYVELPVNDLSPPVSHPNNLQNLEFSKENAQNFYSERATIAERQYANEDKSFSLKPTSQQTDSSDDFGTSSISNSDQRWIEDQCSYPLEIFATPSNEKVQAIEPDLSISHNNTNPILQYAIYGCKWIGDTFDSVSETVRIWLGIPKWMWSFLLAPILKPLKSKITQLPLKRIAALLTPVLVVSWSYGRGIVRIIFPTLRRFIPNRLKFWADGQVVQILNQNPHGIQGQNPAPPQGAPPNLANPFRPLPNNVRRYGWRPGSSKDVTASGLL